MSDKSQTPKQRKRRASARPPNPNRDRIISFRLNASIPDEAQAITILDHHLSLRDSQGRNYTPRYVLTRALLLLDGVELPPPGQDWSGIKELAELFGERFDEIKELIENLRNLGFQQAGPPKRTKRPPLPGAYLANLNRAVKHDDET
jgi:hypothetical protein